MVAVAVAVAVAMLWGASDRSVIDRDWSGVFAPFGGSGSPS